jgi:hypothetical protein
MALAYMYQADLLCAACGVAKRDQIDESSGAPREERTHDDSNDYPAGPYEDGGGEADSPQFCGNHAACLNAEQMPLTGSWAPDKVRGTAAETGKIGAWLENPLTFEGRRVLRKRWYEERCKRAEDQNPVIAFEAECYELDSAAVQGDPCSECKGTSWILNDQMDAARCEECGHERAVEPRS